MAAWCYNVVQFHAEEPTMELLKKLFEAMATKEYNTDQGQLPDFIKEDEGWLFDTDWDSETLYYQTRYSPNIEIMKQVADLFKTDFTFSYELSGDGLFGEYTYINGVLKNLCLDAEDFSKYEYNEETDEWLFEGEYFDNDAEILDILLERKRLQVLGQ
jgi:hypothetical protein